MLVAGRVVVKEPGREAYRRVRQAVADRLRTRPLDNTVPAAIRGGRDLIIRSLLRVRELTRRRIAAADMTEDGEWHHLGEIDVDAKKPLGCLARHRGGNRGAPVATLSDVPAISEAFHQHGPRAGDAVGAPTGGGGLARKPVAR